MLVSCVNSVSCVGSGLCEGLISRTEGSYRVCVCLIVCDVETLTIRRPKPALGCCATEKIVVVVIPFMWLFLK
jgi:hypothetical protein